MSRIVHITSDWSYFTWSIFLWNIEFYHLFLTRLIIKIIKITKKKKNKAAAFITIFLEYCSHFCQFSVLRDNFVRYNAREASFASPFIFCVPVYRRSGVEAGETICAPLEEKRCISRNVKKVAKIFNFRKRSRIWKTYLHT